MKKKLIRVLAFALLALPALAQTPLSSTQQMVNTASFGQAEYYAAAYNYSTNISGGGSTAGGSYAVQVFKPIVTLPGSRQVAVFSVTAPITVGTGANKETVTPTAVSTGCAQQNNPNNICSITATFANAHAQGDFIGSGSAGLQEAINDAYSHGGGNVNIDGTWYATGGTTALVTAAVSFPTVAIIDGHGGAIQYYTASPTSATFLAVPATLTAVTALPSATPVGAYGTGTYHLCISYVDVMGNEGACSLDFSEAGLATGSFIFSAPAASTGAVGFTIYISLTSGTYALAYQVPLTSTICTLTTIETTTPACAVTNATYGQTGATATVTAITVNTSPLALQLGAASTTSDYVGNSNARTVYGYVAGSRVGAPGLVDTSLAFTAGPATVATTVPQVIGTLAVPAGFMNQVGKTIQVCGKLQLTGASATIEQVQFWWDGAGSNAAGVPVKIADLSASVGPNTAAAYNGNFCWTGHTTVSGAGVTAGSIQGDFSYLNEYLASAPAAILVGGDKLTAATGSLNLAGGGGFTSRLHVVQLHTTGTDVSPQLVGMTLTVF